MTGKVAVGAENTSLLPLSTNGYSGNDPELLGAFCGPCCAPESDWHPDPWVYPYDAKHAQALFRSTSPNYTWKGIFIPVFVILSQGYISKSILRAFGQFLLVMVLLISGDFDLLGEDETVSETTRGQGRIAAVSAHWACARSLFGSQNGKAKRTQNSGYLPPTVLGNFISSTSK